MKRVFVTLFVLPVLLWAQDYPEVSIHELMTIPQDSLQVGSLRSAYFGDTVYVTGKVMVPPVVDPLNNRTVILWAGNRWVSFLYDTTEGLQEYAGVNILQFDTTITSTFFDRIRPGDVIRVLCRVANYPPGPQGLTQLEVITADGNQVEFLDSDRPVGTPVHVQISDFYTGPIGNQTVHYESGSRYAGMLVELTDVTVVAATRYDYVIADAEGNQMYLRTQSTYFTKKEDIGGRKPALREWEGFKIGQRLSRVRGFITSARIGGEPASFMITPVYPEDVEISITPPQITSAGRPKTLAFPAPSDSVPVQFIAYPGDAPLDPATAWIIYSTDGGSTFDTVAATQVDDSTFVGMIPPQSAETLVQYFCHIADTSGYEFNYPPDGYHYYRVLDRPARIADVREPILPGGYSAYEGFVVTLEGIVTADTSDIPGRNNPRIYIQDSTAPYSGIFLYTTNPDHPLRGVRRGDRIRVTGEVDEMFRVTILTNIDENVEVLSSGNEVTPVVLSTADFAMKSAGELPAEQWESMLIEFRNVVVVDTNADKARGRNFGEFLVADLDRAQDPRAWMRVETDDGNTSLTTYKDMPDRIIPPIGSKFSFLRGIMYYSFGNYKLVPRKDSDYELVVTAVEEVPDFFAQLRIFPNPVRNQVIADFWLHRSGETRVVINDVQGRTVATHSLGILPYGAHRYRLTLPNLPSGVYVFQVWQGDQKVGSQLVVKE